MKGVIAFDIDGTLTHRLDWIDPKVVCFLNEQVEQGWQVAFLTGRIFMFAERILKHFDFPYIVAVQNGADILDMPSKKVLQRNYFSCDILPQIEHAYQGQKEDFIIYAGIEKGDFCYYRPERFSKKMHEYLDMLKALSDKWHSSNFIFEKGTRFPLIKSFGEKRAMQDLYAQLKENQALEVSIIRDPIDPKLYLNLITDHSASKGHTIQFLRDYLKSPLVIAAGDDHNDLKMLKQADVAIAIETAPEEVLSIADIIAKPAEKLGIIDAVKEAIANGGH